jgi:hypothetical protein
MFTIAPQAHVWHLYHRDPKRRSRGNAELIAVLGPMTHKAAIEHCKDLPPDEYLLTLPARYQRGDMVYDWIGRPVGVVA